MALSMEIGFWGYFTSKSTFFILQVNAFLAIASLTNASESFTSGVTAENVSTLVQSIPKDLNTSSPEEAAKTAINGLGCIAAFARLDESIYEPLARTLLDNNAISTALQFVNSPMPTLRAAACEAMCALSSNNLVDFKTVSVTQGATTSLMSSVTRHANEVAHMHANVLSLLGIGMLLQMDEQAQECIASSSLDIGLLLGFMRQHDDGDVQVLATDIFGVLVRKHKDKVAESMRYAQKSMDANLQYTR